MAESHKLQLTQRPRRMRRTAALRALAEETILDPADFIAPLFVVDGAGGAEEIASMPGVFRHRVSGLCRECRALFELGITAVAVFPKLDPGIKDAAGTAALAEDALVLRAVRAIKEAVPGLTVMTDIALDPYTDHGHDGVLTADGGDVDNDRTVAILARMAVLHAGSGVDLVAPSDMMDGRVGALRTALDEAGFEGTGIMAYSAKFASAYYGPFREAVGSDRGPGSRAIDKRSYQLNPANRREALAEVALDDNEGADILMVKPAGPYLDIIREVRAATSKPVAAYQVSGEYAQIQAAARLGWLDLAATRREALLSIKRAGADMIITYFARDMATELRKG
jgi:porphobilinogen synthase